jgi:5-methyltetrahydropteroyltriglutamate--homocysteine methyltransferase
MIITTVGNYPKTPDWPRPAPLRTALARLDRGEVTLEDLARIEDGVTAEVMSEQDKAGVELLTDGQVRWPDEVTYIAGRLEGTTLSGLVRYFDTNTYYRKPVIVGPIAWLSALVEGDYRFARASSGLPMKPVLTGPYTLARLSNDEYYGDLRTLACAYADALNTEALALADSLPPLIQFNEPAITAHPSWRTTSGGDY